VVEQLEAFLGLERQDPELGIDLAVEALEVVSVKADGLVPQSPSERCRWKAVGASALGDCVEEGIRG
jgi:hypothetical protein